MRHYSGCKDTRDNCLVSSVVPSPVLWEFVWCCGGNCLPSLPLRSTREGPKLDHKAKFTKVTFQKSIRVSGSFSLPLCVFPLSHSRLTR